MLKSINDQESGCDVRIREAMSPRNVALPPFFLTVWLRPRGERHASTSSTQSPAQNELFASGRHVRPCAAPVVHASPPLGFTEALLLEQLHELRLVVPVQVYPLHFLVPVVQNDQVWVVVVDPFNIQVLIILPLLVFFEKRSELGVGRVVEPSLRAALKASFGRRLECRVAQHQALPLFCSAVRPSAGYKAVRWP